jgi:multisubunit Na+/H+ antiporter MnhB subunit
MIGLMIDLVLAVAIVWLALQTVRSGSLFQSMLMYIVFGLLMSLAWARLHAPDLALAEAAIGAGITGALLLVSWRRLQADGHAPEDSERAALSPWLTLPTAGAAAILVALIGWAALKLPATPGTAGELVWQRLDEIGVSNPVTAVLLGFRAYDTLLEMAVLLAAWLGARVVATELRPGALPGPAHAEVSLVGALLSLVVPISVLVAVYLLQAGGSAPGGAFQGGAVLAAGGVLLFLTGRLEAADRTSALERLVLILGLLVFSLTGLLVMAGGGAVLALPGLRAIYLVETAMLLSIALTLVLLFAAAPGLRRAP